MYAITFTGKIETEDKDKFLDEWNKLIKNTNSEIFGKFDFFYFEEYVDKQEQEIDNNEEKRN